MGISTFPAATSSSVIPKTQSYTSSTTFTLPTGYGVSKPLAISYTIVGGGGAGGGFSSTYVNGGGGGGGAVKRGILSATSDLTIVVGSGGSYSSSTRGGDGGASVFGTVSNGANLIPNAFFWNGTSATATTWTFSGTLGTTYTDPTTQTFNDGSAPNGVFQSFAYRQQANTGASTNWTATSNSFTVVAGQTLKNGVYWTDQVASGTGGSIVLSFDFYDASSALVSTVTTATNTTVSSSARKITGTDATVPAGAVTAQFKVRRNASNSGGNDQWFGTYVSATGEAYPVNANNESSFYWSGTTFQSEARKIVTGAKAGGGGGGGLSNSGTSPSSTNFFPSNGSGGAQGGYGCPQANASGKFMAGGMGGGAGGSGKTYASGATGSFSITGYPSSNDYTGNQNSFTTGSGWATFTGTTDSWSLITEVGPGIDGYGMGGPGGVYYSNPTANKMFVRNIPIMEKPYGHGGAGYGAPEQSNTNWHLTSTKGLWTGAGYPGIVILNWSE